MKRNLTYLVIFGFIFGAFSFLGGSAFYTLFQEHDLVIKGEANKHAFADQVVQKEKWEHYGGDGGGNRFVGHDQINRENVEDLDLAWEYHTGALDGIGEDIGTGFPATPILTDNALVFCDQFNNVHAVHPATGKKIWFFDAQVPKDLEPANTYKCRGVSQWRDKIAANTNSVCSHRILMATIDARIIALDAKTGAPCQDFGVNGQVDINPEGVEVKGEFQIVAAPAIVGDILVTGSSILDNDRLTAPPGTIRAYNIRTGEKAWDFDPVPRKDTDPGRDTWLMDSPPTQGGGNVWSTISVDEERGLVVLPTTSASPDFYGGERPGDNKYSDSVVVLDSKTGEIEWAKQIIHHNVWDYDLASQPGLYSVWRGGKRHEIIAQATKMGLVFTMDRETGKPFHDIVERPVSQDGADGEWLSPTQPFPVAPPNLLPTEVDPKKDAFGITYWDKKWCEHQIKKVKWDGLYTPPSEQGTLFFPSTAGGNNWGSFAYDETRNLMIVGMMNMMQKVTLVETDPNAGPTESHGWGGVMAQSGARYGAKVRWVQSPLRVPCNKPPWGILSAVDLDSGEIVWRRTLGTTRDLAFGGIPMKYGTPSSGGPMITGGDLIFMGATLDYYLRAFDINTGDEMWKHRLPAGGQATPMSYMWEGKQYVVISAGGYKFAGTKLGDSVMAFALPSE
ncbi:MAG: pyrroloquinoline quinone-dependent dehydrogenase [Maricaulaceae bacterium]